MPSRLETIFGGSSAAGDDPREPLTARVVRSDPSGVWVVALGDDQRTPIGPCRGGHRPVLVEDGDTYELQHHPLPQGTVVLLIDTDEGPWVAAWDI